MKDSFGRQMEILRISVTDKCNFRCIYCMPESGVPPIPHDKIMRFEEIREVASIAISLGIKKMRLTGGEPLVRRGIVRLVAMLADLQGIEDLSMTTNGSLLAPMAADLKAAGLKRINISLDTIDPVRFREITRGGRIEDVLDGISAASAAGLNPIKLNIVVDDETRDEDARSVEEYAKTHGLESRRIRWMDIRKGIFSVVQHSDRGDCPVCNRLRLTCDGFIRACLFSNIAFDIRRLGAEEAIRQAVQSKPQRGNIMTNAYMNQIGG